MICRKNAARVGIAGRDPVACDLFFHKYAWNYNWSYDWIWFENKTSKKARCLFGVRRAFIGGIESQGKGTLHVHLIVLLAGFPKDSDEILHLMKADQDFQQRMYSFFDSVTQSSAEESHKNLTYPICDEKGSLEPVKYSKISYTQKRDLTSPQRRNM